VSASWRRRVALLVAALAALFAGSVGLAASAGAHAQLVGSNPADGTTIQSSPPQLRIDLSQSVFPDRTTVTMTDSSGRAVPITRLAVTVTGARPGDPGLVPRAGAQGRPTTIVADVPALPPEIYRVSWRTLSTDDLHVTSGVFVFGVQRAVAHQAGQVSDPLPPLGELVIRAFVMLGAAVAVGAGTVFVLLGAEVDAVPAVRRRLLAVAAGASGLSAVLGVVLLLLQADVFSGGLTFAADVLSSPAFLVRWAGREAAAIAAAVAFGLALGRDREPGGGRGRRLGAGIVLLGVFAATTALLGHTGNGSRVLDVVAHAAHVAGALVWVGTLLTVLLLLAGPRLRRRVLADEALRRHVLGRFALVGLGCVIVIVASGLVLTGAGTVSLDALLLSTYGRLVLLKALALVTAVAAAAAMTATLHPHLVPARLRPRILPGAGRNRLLLPAEVALLVTALALGTAAAGARPALGTEWTPTSAAPPLLSRTVADLVETVKVGPNAPGPVTGVDVGVRRSAAPDEVVHLTAQGAGTWLGATDAFEEPGPWSLTVVAHRAGLPDVRTDYAWLVADPSARLGAPLVSSAPYRGVLDGLALAVLLGGLALVGVLVGLARRAGHRDEHEPEDEPADEQAEPAGPPGTRVPADVG
jgi:copper transport protein